MTSPAPGGDPERRLALRYAPASARGALDALFALDATLGAILRSTTEPMVGQIRLTWWHEALERLDAGMVPAEPVLSALAHDVLGRGVTGAQLAGMIDGWEALLDTALDGHALEAHAAARGGGLFGAAGVVLGAWGDPVAAAGQGWALADLSRRLSDQALAMAARDRARPLLRAACAARWSRAGRALGALAHLARRDLDIAPGESVPVGAPGRVARIFWHRISGF